jgi:hypothetical protein
MANALIQLRQQGRGFTAKTTALHVAIHKSQDIGRK